MIVLSIIAGFFFLSYVIDTSIKELCQTLRDIDWWNKNE